MFIIKRYKKRFNEYIKDNTLIKCNNDTILQESITLSTYNYRDNKHFDDKLHSLKSTKEVIKQTEKLIEEFFDLYK